MASTDDSVHTRPPAAAPLDLSSSVAAATAARELAASRLPVFVERLATLVGIDSGDDCPEGRERVAEVLAGWAAEAGCSCDFVPTPSGRHLVARLPGTGTGRIVLLGHHDTVFARGTAAARPLTQAGGRVLGPGVADMKGGLLLALLAIEALAGGERPFAALELHSAPDEEIRTSVLPALPHVHGAAAALVFECGRENGDVVVGRKAGAWVHLSATGRPAHAGTEPERGRNAVLALCRELLRSDDLNGARAGLTVIAGTFAGGTIPNVVPERAAAVVDVRAESSDDLRWALERIADVSHGDGIAVDVTVEGPWPGIERNPGTSAMFDAARHLAARLGFAVGGQTSGGVSDGCWTSADGVPTLDGLGPVGGLDHSADEYILLDSIASRCGLAAGLCDAVGRGLLDGRLGEGGGPTGSL